MKIELKSEFWDNTDIDEWRKRHERLLYIVGVFGVIIFAVGINFLSVMIMGLFLVMVSFLGIFAKNKWSKKNGKK